MTKALSVFFLLAICALWYFQPTAPTVYNYPNSTIIFKKYYPENEILGMAYDQSWRIVSTSNDTLDTINAWYAEKFKAITATENHGDVHCIRPAWQDNNKAIHITLCDHGSYRTVLSVIPK